LPYHAVAHGISVQIASCGSRSLHTYETNGGKYGGYGTWALGPKTVKAAGRALNSTTKHINTGCHPNSSNSSRSIITKKKAVPYRIIMGRKTFNVPVESPPQSESANIIRRIAMAMHHLNRLTFSPSNL